MEYCIIFIEAMLSDEAEISSISLKQSKQSHKNEQLE
jgi:hypothetical protein